MVTLAQRIEELRTARGLSRPALAAALGFPRTAIEKFETGRQTPTQDQQNKLASYFGVSLFYLRGETNDTTQMSDWMDGAFLDEPAPVPAPRRAAVKPAVAASSGAGPQAGGEAGGGVLRRGGRHHVRRVPHQQEIPGGTAHRGAGYSPHAGGPGAPDQGHPERAGESAEVMCGGERGGGS